MRRAWLVALLVAGVVGMPCPTPAQAPRTAPAHERFTLGASPAEVRRVQGAPTLVERYASLGVEIWSYGTATVRFAADSGAERVIGWDNRAGTLRVSLPPAPRAESATTFTFGTPRDDVARLQGTPAIVRRERATSDEYWSFGASVVRLASTDGRVVGWWNVGNLRVPHAADSLARLAWETPAGARSTRLSSGSGASATPTSPGAPLTLDATVRFREPSGNGALDAGERAWIDVTVRNRGPGGARQVGVSVAADSTAAGIAIGTAAPITVLAPTASTTLTIPLVGAAELADGTARLRVTVREGNGFDVDPPRRVTIRTAAARPAKLALAGVRIDDQSNDGRVVPRELVEITARLWNGGSGDARDVRVTIVPGENTFLAQDSPARRALGTIIPGESRDVDIIAYTNSRAQSLTLRLVLEEASGRYGATLPIVLALDRPIASTLDIAPAPVVDEREATPPAAPPPLLDEIERDIPKGARNPDAIAIILGVERYRDLPTARFAARDAALVRRYAVDVLGVPDERNHLHVRTDADVTGNEFRKLFGDDGWLARRAQPGSDIYVYFAGHGAPELSSRAPFLLPADGDASYPRETGFPLATLYEQLAKLRVRSITVFLDACFTGSTRSRAPLVAGTRDLVLSVEHPALRRDDMAVIAAAHGDQIASDYPAKRHGLFTYFLLAGLRGAADANGDGDITVRELEQFVAARVRRVAGTLDREQEPLVIAKEKDRVLVRLR